MSYIQLFIELFILMIFMEKNLVQSDDVYYTADFNDEVKECDDFQNDVFKCDSLTVGTINDGDGEGSLGLTGKLNVLDDISEDFSVDLKVWKETDFAKEFMYTITGNLCESLHKKDTPWWPLVQVLNASSCPIKKGEYIIKDLVMSLDFAKEVLRHEFVGDYEIKLTFLDKLETQLSCHIISVGISEKTKG